MISPTTEKLFQKIHGIAVASRHAEDHLKFGRKNHALEYIPIIKKLMEEIDKILEEQNK